MTRTRYPVALLVAGVLAAGCASPTSGAAPAQPWAWELPHCAAYDPGDYRAPGQRVAATRDGAETTERYRPGWGATAMAEIRQVVAACARYEHGKEDGFREQHTVEERDFAGDGALLVRSVRLAPPAPEQIWYAAVVRRGDTLVTMYASTRDDAVCPLAPATCRGGGA